MKFPHTKRFTWPLGLTAATLILLSGCAVSHHAYLVPAPSANLTNGGQAATASADGVVMTVTPNDWNGRPHDLYGHVTPLRVRIQNNSKHPVRVAYEDFKIESPQGRTFAALPPSQIRGTEYGQNNLAPYPGSGPSAKRAPSALRLVDASWRKTDPPPRRQHHDHDFDRGGGTTVVVTPGFDWDDFYYAPYWGYGYVGIGPWPYWWGPDMGYYNTYYPYMRSFRLPTRSMLRKGIPEGVIAPGGYVDGFLYFSKVNPSLTSVQFVAALQEAKTGRHFGTIRIPFQVEQQPSSGY